MTQHIVQFGLSFGALAPTIKEQLLTMQFDFNEHEVEWFDKYKLAINYLFFADLLTDKEKDKVQAKLFKRIEKHIRKKNKDRIASLQPKIKVQP